MNCIFNFFLLLLFTSALAQDNGLAPEVTDLNAEDISFSKEKEILYLTKPFISKSPKDLKDGIPVGILGKDGGDIEKIMAFVHEIIAKDDNNHKTDSLLISYKGRLIFESYYKRGRINYPHYQMSITKSYTALALGRAVQMRYLSMEDLHKPAVNYLKGLDKTKLAAGVEKITVHQAMQMKSGIRLDSNKIKEIMKTPENLKGIGQLQAYFSHTAPIPDKNIDFKYQASDPAITMQLVEALVPGTAKDFIKIELLGKLGISNYGWQEDISGLPKSAAGSSLRSRDMLKMGMLLMNKGKWKGEQLIPEKFVELATSPLTDSWGGNSYGYFWWVSKYEIDSKTYICKAGRGAGGQFIFMFPEIDLIAVVTAHNKGMGTMLKELPPKIIPAFTHR